jgi:hypothetical protein
MNISHKDLRRIFESYTESKKGTIRTSCPSLEELMKSTKKLFSPIKKRYILEHVSSCTRCASDLKWILEILLESEYLGHSINELAEKRRNSFGYGIPLNHAVALFLGILSLSICIWTLFVGGSFVDIPKERNRIDQIQKWRYFEPIGTIEAISFSQFRWNYEGQANLFTIILFDETLAPIWKSPELNTNKIQLPEEIKAIIRPGKPYFWLILAHDRNGQLFESDLNKFELKTNY